MSFVRKIIISNLLGLMSITVCAMECSKKESSVSSDVSLYGSILNLNFNDVVQYATNKLVSLNNTAQNLLSDDAILLKLGWTSSQDDVQKRSAKDELKKSKQIYHDARTLEYGNPAYLYNREAKDRRRGFLSRALVMLEDHIISKQSDRISLALHFLDHHHEVMNNFDRAGLKKIIPHETWNKRIYQKLGWPSSDLDAQKKLKKIKKFYDDNISNPLSSSEKGVFFVENHILLEHLREYCQEILLAFYHNTITDHSERASLALHCVEHHKLILSEVDVAKLLWFAKQSQQKIELDKQEIDEKLTSLTAK